MTWQDPQPAYGVFDTRTLNMSPGSGSDKVPELLVRSALLGAQVVEERRAREAGYFLRSEAANQLPQHVERRRRTRSQPAGWASGKSPPAVEGASSAESAEVLRRLWRVGLPDGPTSSGAGTPSIAPGGAAAGPALDKLCNTLDTTESERPRTSSGQPTECLASPDNQI